MGTGGWHRAEPGLDATSVAETILTSAHASLWEQHPTHAVGIYTAPPRLAVTCPLCPHRQSVRLGPAPRPGWASAPFSTVRGKTEWEGWVPGRALGAHLDGERDVCVGTEAPAPVAGAVVEAAACTGTDVGVRPGHPLTCRVPPTRGSAPGKALGLQMDKVNRAPGHVTIPCHHGHSWRCPHGCSHR